jgi:hypothetical protein
MIWSHLVWQRLSAPWVDANDTEWLECDCFKTLKCNARATISAQSQ